MSTLADKIGNSNRKTRNLHRRPPFECIALLLQGGGALGAYQAGVYQALSEASLHPDWVAGISIGAINSALIAGNPADKRVEKLRKFWELVTMTPLWPETAPIAAANKNASACDRAPHATGDATANGAPRAALVTNGRDADDHYEFWNRIATSLLSSWPSGGDLARGVANQISAALAVVRGAPGFFAPRLPIPWLQPDGTLEATSYYDSTALRATLERLVDFDRINAGEVRFSVGAVSVGTGNFVYFDNTTHTIGPQHVMASAALPPALPAIEIDGEHYWDGGLVSNTPLQRVLESDPLQDTLAFQVDLWSAGGAFPRNMAEVATRQKEIQYSSRTRANSDRFKYTQTLRNALSSLLERLPDELRESRELAVLGPVANRKVYNLVQLVYRSKQYESHSKDYEFSRASMQDHWRAGYHDTVRTLRHPEVLERPNSLEGVFSFDLAQDGRE
jgi:NTE family protein